MKFTKLKPRRGPIEFQELEHGSIFLFQAPASNDVCLKLHQNATYEGGPSAVGLTDGRTFKVPPNDLVTPLEGELTFWEV